VAVGGGRFHDATREEAAPYSNAGWALDVLSMGGDLDEDRDDNSIPDGVVAQTIDPLDPTRVGFWAMAGSSQAAAVASSQAASLLSQGLAPALVRDALVLGTHLPKNHCELCTDSGAGIPDSAGLQAALPGAAAVPDVFVNTVGAVQRVSGKARAVAKVEVVGPLGLPLPGVAVYGGFAGSVPGQQSQTTNAQGVATFTSPTSSVDPATQPAFFLFNVDAVGMTLPDGSVLPVVPGGFYRLSEGNAARMMSVLEGPNAAGGLLFRIAPGDSQACSAVGCSSIVTSYLARSLGSGFSSSTVNVIFNQAWLQATGGAGFSSSTVNALLPGTFWFPWGSSSSAPYDVVTLDGSGFSSSTVNVLRWDGSMWGSGFSSSTVNVLAYDSRLWGTGFSSSTVNLHSWGATITAASADAGAAEMAGATDLAGAPVEISLP